MPVANCRKLSFVLVDVFSNEPLAGNPLAVVDDADDLTVDEMRQLAAEFNQAETTFLLRPTMDGANIRLRSFTATGTEVVGPGHNALGAWWHLAEKGGLGRLPDIAEFRQEIGSRVLPLTIRADGGNPTSIEMSQSSPMFGSRVRDHGRLAKALGVDERDLDFHELSAQIVSTGVPHLMVAMKDRDAVDRVEPDAPALRELLLSHDGQGCYVYSLDPTVSEATAYARFFNPVAGIREDSATGTAAGPLTCRLIAQGTAKEGEDTVIEQGRRMGRPSLIHVRVTGESVRISGSCFTSATGEVSVGKPHS